MPVTDDKTVISRGSKSFYLASFFFSQPVKEAAWKLYRWCRYCDDQVDQAPSLEIANERLKSLRTQTLAALDPRTEPSSLLPEFQSLREICFRYQIPQKYPLDLLQGFEMDVMGLTYETVEEVELYSYHVAGVVGLMMTRIFGASSPLAGQHAIHLGTAMQLTNIARDVHEDFQIERLYLPKTWLLEFQVDPKQLLEAHQHHQVFSVVDRLLDRASDLYRSGYSGLRYLPLRAALAVSIAGSIYSFIGYKVRRQRQLHRRTFVSFPEKLALVFVGALRVLPLACRRLLKPWKDSRSLETWRTL